MMRRVPLLLVVFVLTCTLVGVAADDQNALHWLTLFAIAILGWLAIALAVGTVVGHAIAFGTGRDQSPTRDAPNRLRHFDL